MRSNAGGSACARYPCMSSRANRSRPPMNGAMLMRCLLPRQGVAREGRPMHCFPDWRPGDQPLSRHRSSPPCRWGRCGWRWGGGRSSGRSARGCPHSMPWPPAARFRSGRSMRSLPSLGMGRPGRLRCCSPDRRRPPPPRRCVPIRPASSNKRAGSSPGPTRRGRFTRRRCGRPACRWSGCCSCGRRPTPTRSGPSPNACGAEASGRRWQRPSAVARPGPAAATCGRARRWGGASASTGRAVRSAPRPLCGRHPLARPPGRRERARSTLARPIDPRSRRTDRQSRHPGGLP